MNISIIQFEPIVGGETTLTKNLKKILEADGHQIRVYHPCLEKNGELMFSNSWVQVGDKIPLEKIKFACEQSDLSIFINSMHISPTFFLNFKQLFESYSNIKGCKIAFYEHGLHTWDFCNYENLYKILSKKNKVSFLTNTVEAIEYYKSRGLSAFLCRQPFFPENFPKVSRQTEGPLNLCFNSRFSAQKGVQSAFHYFEEFLEDPTLNFSMNFRDSGKHHDLKTKIQQTLHGKVFPMSKEPWEIYENQDYCIYFGYNDPRERGKLEYSMLEAFHYDIPVIAHPSWTKSIKEEYKVYGPVAINMDPYELKKMLRGSLRYGSLPETKKLLEKFLPVAIISNFNYFLDSVF